MSDGQPPPRTATAVIGAGPAGLLFCVVARLRLAARGAAPESWPIGLFDKRARYERTHTLRLDPRVWRELQRSLGDSRFDALLDFLAAEGFRPTVNALEERLSGMAAMLGVRKEILCIGTEPGDLDLAGLRARLEAEGRLGPADLLTIVASDSVHSAVREQVRGSEAPVERTHQHVARLRIVGRDLPERLGPIEQFRLSKVLGSIIDYRLNPNGFAEVDLFLTGREHRGVVALGATPREPVLLTDGRLAALRAPFFRRIVEHLRGGFRAGPREVWVQSTFRLEDRYMRRVAYDLPELSALVFLVGDAAVSLPFFRGMACLARCVDALARAHVDLVTEAAPPAGAARRYEADVAAIRAAEMRVVDTRARLVRIAREVIRVSALLPFPIQAWLLSVPEPDAPPEGISAGLALNATLAIAALACAAAALAPPPIVPSPLAAPLGAAALGLQALGGVAYNAVRGYEPGGQVAVRRVWRFQIALALLGGVLLASIASVAAGRLAHLPAALAWLALGAAFTAGLYVHDALDRRWHAQAELTEP